MKLIDVHSHWGTKRGYPLQTEEELALQRQTWNSEVRYHSEAEMAQHFRDQGVQAILDLGFAKYRPLEPRRSHEDPRRRKGAAPLHRQAPGLPRFRRVELAHAAGERSCVRSLLP